MKRPIRAMAFAPLCGALECPSRPTIVVTCALTPLCALTTRMLVGSPMIASAGFGSSVPSSRSSDSTPRHVISSS